MANFFILSAISIVIGIGGILTVTLIYSLTGRVVPVDNGVVVDAGSTHTEIILYNWLADKEKGTGIVVEEESCRISGGLAKNTNATQAAESLLGCLTNISHAIPAGETPTTSIFLGATAGFRLLNEINQSLSDNILSEVNKIFSQYGFNPEQVAIISGQNEGLYAWITTNFLNKTLKSSQETLGAMDLGGASTQISFSTPEKRNESITLRLYGVDHHVTAQSSLCFGVEESYRRHLAELVVNSKNSTDNILEPCAPVDYPFNRTCNDLFFNQPCTQNLTRNVCKKADDGDEEFFFRGIGNSSVCSDHVTRLLDHDTCQKMYPEDHCFQPITAPTNQPFYAISSFYYTIDFLNATEKSLKFFQNASKVLCAKTADEVKEIPTTSPKDTLYQFCFQSILIEHMLIDYYSFNDSTWENIKFLKKLNKNDLGWALGYMINATNAIPAESPTEPSVSLVAMILVVIVCVALLAVGGFFIWKKKHIASEVSYVPV